MEAREEVQYRIEIEVYKEDYDLILPDNKKEKGDLTVLVLQSIIDWYTGIKKLIQVLDKRARG